MRAMNHSIIRRIASELLEAKGIKPYYYYIYVYTYIYIYIFVDINMCYICINV